ncbi:hypothetical protein AVEN_270389-1 [Araneus ventricosus]|uniref:Uncharacterized protein n=1 Tax=Araneus ventricosus TaxID=182803 RepID=A0A4Y2R303_ARAVE|nr:hypothetical protein AVEN_270389-1 [Araneus ventricosus]
MSRQDLKSLLFVDPVDLPNLFSVVRKLRNDVVMSSKLFRLQKAFYLQHVYSRLQKNKFFLNTTYWRVTGNSKKGLRKIAANLLELLIVPPEKSTPDSVLFLMSRP